MTEHDNLRLDKPLELELKKQISHAFFYSFHQSQGSQELQLDVLSWVGTKWKENGVVLPVYIKDTMNDWVQKINVPVGHSPVTQKELREQFSFWWDLMWDVMKFQLNGDKSQIPSVETLFKRVSAISADNPNWTLEKDKLLKITERIELNSFDLNSNDKMSKILLPRLIKVEKSFQTPQEYKTIVGRERTDGGDRFECRMLTNIRHAQLSLGNLKAFTVYDQLYIDISNHLNSLESAKIMPLQFVDLWYEYTDLLNAYNKNHPDNKTQYLYK